jgi:hypothetical protein
LFGTTLALVARDGFVLGGCCGINIRRSQHFTFFVDYKLAQ